MNIQINFKWSLKNRQRLGMYNVSWQAIPFPYNANKERIFVTITNCFFQIKFIVMVSSCSRTIGKLEEIEERKMLNTKN